MNGFPAKKPKLAEAAVEPVATVKPEAAVEPVAAAAVEAAEPVAAAVVEPAEPVAAAAVEPAEIEKCKKINKNDTENMDVKSKVDLKLSLNGIGVDNPINRSAIVQIDTTHDKIFFTMDGEVYSIPFSYFEDHIFDNDLGEQYDKLKSCIQGSELITRKKLEGEILTSKFRDANVIYVRDVFYGQVLPGLNAFIDPADQSVFNFAKKAKIDIDLTKSEQTFYNYYNKTLGKPGNFQNFKYSFLFQCDVLICSYILKELNNYTSRINDDGNKLVVDGGVGYDKIDINIININFLWHKLLKFIEASYKNDAYYKKHQKFNKDWETAINFLRSLVFENFDVNKKYIHPRIRYGLSQDNKLNGILTLIYGYFYKGTKIGELTGNKDENSEFFYDTSQNMSAANIKKEWGENKQRHIDPRGGKSKAKKKDFEKGINKLLDEHLKKDGDVTKANIARALVWLIFKYAGDSSHLEYGELIECAFKTGIHESLKKKEEGKEEGVGEPPMEVIYLVQERPFLARLLLANKTIIISGNPLPVKVVRNFTTYTYEDGDSLYINNNPKQLFDNTLKTLIKTIAKLKGKEESFTEELKDIESALSELNYENNPGYDFITVVKKRLNFMNKYISLGLNSPATNFIDPPNFDSLKKNFQMFFKFSGRFSGNFIKYDVIYKNYFSPTPKENQKVKDMRAALTKFILTIENLLDVIHYLEDIVDLVTRTEIYKKINNDVYLSGILNLINDDNKNKILKMHAFDNKTNTAIIKNKLSNKGELNTTHHNCISTLVNLFNNIKKLANKYNDDERFEAAQGKHRNKNITQKGAGGVTGLPSAEKAFIKFGEEPTDGARRYVQQLSYLNQRPGGVLGTNYFFRDPISSGMSSSQSVYDQYRGPPLFRGSPPSREPQLFRGPPPSRGPPSSRGQPSSRGSQPRRRPPRTRKRSAVKRSAADNSQEEKFKIVKAPKTVRTVKAPRKNVQGFNPSGRFSSGIVPSGRFSSGRFSSGIVPSVRFSNRRDPREFFIGKLPIGSSSEESSEPEPEPEPEIYSESVARNPVLNRRDKEKQGIESLGEYEYVPLMSRSKVDYDELVASTIIAIFSEYSKDYDKNKVHITSDFHKLVKTGNKPTLEIIQQHIIDFYKKEKNATYINENLQLEGTFDYFNYMLNLEGILEKCTKLYYDIYISDETFAEEEQPMIFGKKNRNRLLTKKAKKYTKKNTKKISSKKRNKKQK